MNRPASVVAADVRSRDTGAHPAHPLFWARRGAGHATLLAAAWLHSGAGIVAAASCALLWARAGASQRYLLELAIVGGAVAVAGLLAALLSLPRAAAPAQIARTLLPAVDLAAAGAAYWLLGARTVVLPLFLVPAAIAAVLLSWRGGVVFAALSQVGYCTLAALRMGPSLGAWVPETLVLAGLLLLLTGCSSFYIARVEAVTEALQTRLGGLRRDRAAQAAEQTRLLDGLTLMEETQARLDQERVQINAQIVALAAAAQRLAEGDPSGVRALPPGMYGPLDLLTAALNRLSSPSAPSASAAPRGVRPAAAPSPSPSSVSTFVVSPKVDDSLGDALREQGRLLTAADALLRDLGVRANELMAAAQTAGGANADWHVHDNRTETLAAALRDIERLAQEQSAGAATLGSRLAQLLVRQSDLDASLRRPVAPQPADSAPVTAVTPLWPAAPSSAGTTSSGPGISSSRHVSAWDPPPAVSRVASGPLR